MSINEMDIAVFICIRSLCQDSIYFACATAMREPAVNRLSATNLYHGFQHVSMPEVQLAVFRKKVKGI